jgi:NIPSNAP
MIYELRVYKAVPGQMPKLLARFRDKLLPIWERHGIRPIGFWTTLVGGPESLILCAKRSTRQSRRSRLVALS